MKTYDAFTQTDEDRTDMKSVRLFKVGTAQALRVFRGKLATCLQSHLVMRANAV